MHILVGASVGGGTKIGTPLHPNEATFPGWN